MMLACHETVAWSLIYMFFFISIGILDIYFSHKATSNFLSRDACKAFGIIPKGFPHEQLNSVKGGQKPQNLVGLEVYSQTQKAGGQKPLKSDGKVEYSQKSGILEYLSTYWNALEYIF